MSHHLRPALATVDLTAFDLTVTERACVVDLDEVIRLRSRAVISHAGTVVSIEDDGDPATLSAAARLALGGHCTPKGLNPLGLHVYHLGSLPRRGLVEVADVPPAPLSTATPLRRGSARRRCTAPTSARPDLGPA